MMMLQQQANDHAENSSHAYVHTLAGTDGHARQSCFALSIGAHLDPGIRRKHRPNEDTVLITHGVMPFASLEPFVLLAVADGMRGPGHGQEASQLAARSLVAYMSGSLTSLQRSPQDWLSQFTAGVQYANRVVHERNQQQQTIMGTTMTAVIVNEATAYIARVGDSRLYLYREPTGLVQITNDHSVVASLVVEGIIAPDDIYTHHKRNQIYRSGAVKPAWKWTLLPYHLPLMTSQP